MSTASPSLRSTIVADMTASVVVFLVAIPLCLGIALASGAPLFSGLLAGIIGGLVVGSISGSHTSVSGPANSLMPIIATQIAVLGSFEALLLAVMIAGVMQIIAGVCRAGFIAMFMPTSVIKGLLSAIGIILILKQIPHIVGHDSDPEGDMAFAQPDNHNTFSEFLTLFEGQWHLGAAAIGVLSILLLVAWERVPLLKNSPIPGPLAIVVMGLGLSELFAHLGSGWAIGASHLVQVPVAESFSDVRSFLTHPDFSQWAQPPIYAAAVTIALIASLETLLNLEAVDRIDPQRRHSPPSRELVAQGVGNMVAGLVGGIPITSVIVRSSVNVNSGGKTKLATILHGVLLTACILFVPQVLNKIPLSALAGILLVTGFKLASPKLMRQMYSRREVPVRPYIITVLAIVFTDLLIGVLIGLAVARSFILYSSMKQPLRRVLETHVGGDVLRIELANQVSFLNRAAIDRTLNDVQRGGHVLIDAENSIYIDPDVLALVREFKNKTGPARGINVSLRGFRDKYQLQDEIQYVDFSTRATAGTTHARRRARDSCGPATSASRAVSRMNRDLKREVHATADGQHPMAVVLSCMDSRAPVEMLFDVGIGDLFSVRVAGNVSSRKVLASIEYGCVIASAPLVLVMGHTRCGAVGATVQADLRPARCVR